MMEFTSGWTREGLRTQADYDKWVSTLKDGDACIVQEFLPQGDHLFSSLVEGWRFWKARYEGNRIIYNNDSHPLRKDGILCYYNDDSPWGAVFSARIVPNHNTLHRKHYESKICHAPVFEPEWINNDRCVFFASSNRHTRNHDLSDVITRYYRRDVDYGELIIVFGKRNELIESLKDFNLTFCYSENLMSKI